MNTKTENTEFDLAYELKTAKNYNEKIKVYDKYIQIQQSKTATATDKNLLEATTNLSKALNQKNNFMQMEATKKELQDVSIEDLKKIIRRKEYKEMKLNKKTIEEVIALRQEEQKQKILNEYTQIEIITSNINGTPQDTGYILQKDNIVYLVSFNFLNATFNLDTYDLKIFTNHRLVYSKNNGNHMQHFYEFIKTYLENKGFDGFEDTKKLTYSMSYNYLHRLIVDKENKTISFNGFEDVNFFEENM